MKNGKLFGLLILILPGLQSCKEIMATDISETVPVMILPQVNDTVENNPVHFKWEEVDGATKYHLQIVSTSFSNIETYAIDSMVTGESIFISLDSNEYELMLTAVNEGYSSHTLGPVKFWVGVQPAETSGFVTLVSPADGSFFNADYAESDDFQDGEFHWNTLTGAASYEFILRKGSSYTSPNAVEIESKIVQTASYQLDEALTEGKYYWGVRAYYSSGAETSVSIASFTIDTTIPVVPTLVSPTGLEDLDPGEITFTWQSSSDPGDFKSTVSTVLEVARDINFLDGLETETFSGSSGTMNLSGTGQYYWRVRNVDEAGNYSAYSTVGEFTL